MELTKADRDAWASAKTLNKLPSQAAPRSSEALAKYAPCKVHKAQGLYLGKHEGKGGRMVVSSMIEIDGELTLLQAWEDEL